MAQTWITNTNYTLLKPKMLQNYQCLTTTKNSISVHLIVATLFSYHQANNTHIPHFVHQMAVLHRLRFTI